MIGKNKEWRYELDMLVRSTGVTLEDVCEYIGVHYPGTIGFYRKIPRERETFIGIGMAFRRDLETINGWIVRYGDKRKLYAKDVLSDLIWIYLINCNQQNFSDTNFFCLYEECRRIIQDTYIALWNEYIANDEGTATVEKGLAAVHHDPTFRDLQSFVAENMDAFKTAYRNPRNMLAEYVKVILGTYTRANEGKETPINFLRGYLDDSMMNYITGSSKIINVIDMKSRDRVINSKSVPKLKRTHIALCLALGMSTTDEIDRYLGLMGYQPLDPESKDEDVLVEELQRWNESHPLVQRFKDVYFRKAEDGEEALSIQEELQAVSDMLMLRSDLEHEYRLTGRTFPYMKD